MFKREVMILLALLLAPIVVALVMAFFGPMILSHVGAGSD